MNRIAGHADISPTSGSLLYAPLYILTHLFQCTPGKSVGAVDIPYQAFATGVGIDKDGYYLAIALLNPSEEVARENATLLEQRINQSKIAMAWHSQSGDKWSDLIESMEIESKGRLTLARLYGAVVECWVNFNVMGMMGPYEPLLIHE